MVVEVGMAMTDREARARIAQVIAAAVRVITRATAAEAAGLLLAITLAGCGVSGARAWVTPLAFVTFYLGLFPLGVCLALRKRARTLWGDAL